MGELPTVCAEYWVKRSRKEHRCTECGGTIKKGWRYWRCAGLWDGVWETFRMHQVCNLIYEGQRDYWLKDCEVHPEERPAFGEMVAMASEDAGAIEGFPPYWPQGVYIDRRELAAYVEEHNDGQRSDENKEAAGAKPLGEESGT
jgi:hypothetical protein